MNLFDASQNSLAKFYVSVSRAPLIRIYDENQLNLIQSLLWSLIRLTLVERVFLRTNYVS